MKYEIKFSCGHMGIVECYGKESARERELYGYRHYGKCETCLQKEREEKVKQEKANAEMLGLPALEGSEKQKAWAENIRAKVLDNKSYKPYFSQFFERRQEAIELYNSAEWEEYMKKPNKRTFDVALYYFYRIITETQAKYYIDNRFEIYEDM